MINHVLFDLDGTLVDTAVDLANALNVVRQHKGLEVLPLDVIKPTVSLGGNAMINLAFGLKEYDEGFEEIRDAFLRHYSENIAIHSRLFDGMETVLNHIEDKNIPWGIVTNKSKWLTNPFWSPSLNLINEPNASYPATPLNTENLILRRYIMLVSY